MFKLLCVCVFFKILHRDCERFPRSLSDFGRAFFARDSDGVDAERYLRRGELRSRSKAPLAKKCEDDCRVEAMLGTPSCA